MSDTQIQSLEQIRGQEGDALRSIRDEMRQKHQTLAQQLQVGSTDAAGSGYGADGVWAASPVVERCGGRRLGLGPPHPLTSESRM